MPTETPPTREDLVARLAGLAPDSPIVALRAHRAESTRQTHASHQALFDGALDDLPLAERLAAAAYAAALASAGAASAVYRERLDALGASGEYAAAVLDRITRDNANSVDSLDSADADALLAAQPSRLGTILAHTRAVTMAPAQTAAHGPAALASLQNAGLSTRAIVVLSQLIAFVSYQVRVVAALRALESLQ